MEHLDSNQPQGHGNRWLAPLRFAVAIWAFAGTVGVPAAVYGDFLQGWRWKPYNAIYDQMMVSLYVALGIVAFFAIRAPLQHRSFLWFIVLSSLLHGGVMAFHAVAGPAHREHLYGDVWILAGALLLAVPLFMADLTLTRTTAFNN